MGRSQRSATDYFLGSRTLPWSLVAFSVVATETSTLTVISVPGLAYHGDMTFLQLAFGYVIGRIAVAFLLLPSYFRGESETAYAFLGQRFGRAPQATASVMFLVTRVLADGVRLFATAIPLALITGWSYAVCILIIGAVTVLYTYIGGIRSVVWLDSVQLILYLSGAVIALWIVTVVVGGWSGITGILPAEKFTIIDPGLDEGWRGLFTGGYKLPAALLGGAFLSMASHGTDQLLVQRLLSTRGLRQAQLALIASGVIVVFQFLLFLMLGSALAAFYEGAPIPTDQVFPRYILEGLPPGLSGLLLAAIFAAAMSTLSSSLNSLASSTVFDLFRSRNRSTAADRTGDGEQPGGGDDLRRGRLITLVWAGVLVGGAMLFRSTDNPVVELGLSIASVTYGGFLGTFLLGRFTTRPGPRAAVASLLAGVVTAGALVLFTGIFWVWLVPFGCATSFAAGLILSRIPGFEPTAQP
jgi:SSS family transporter